MTSQLASSVSTFISDLKSACAKKTFMFLDIFSSTEFKISRPDTAWVPAIAGFYQQAIESIEAHDGAIIKFLGDGVMATFDEATSALMAAVHLQESLQESRAQKSTELRCKIGIATGEAFRYTTADDRYDYLGTPVDLAARLCNLANGNAILLNSRTRQSADQAAITSIAGRALGREPEEYFGEKLSAELKGFKEPISYSVLFWQGKTEGFATPKPVLDTPREKAPKPIPKSPQSETGERKGTNDPRRVTGTLFKMAGEGSYGFISLDSDDSPDGIFVHNTSTVGGSELRVGSRVSFFLSTDQQGRLNAKSAIVFGARISGTVARYNPQGFGFVQAIDSRGQKTDFFVSPKNIEGTIVEGVNVSFEPIETPRGLQAVNVRGPASGSNTPDAASSLTVGEVEEGKVSYFSEDRGYGFINCEGERVFVHARNIAEDEQVLEPGEWVRFEVTPGRNGEGFAAKAVQVLEEAA